MDSGRSPQTLFTHELNAADLQKLVFGPSPASECLPQLQLA